MSNETPNNPQLFANKYPVPEDQLAFELSLRDSFASRFPDSLPVMNEALSDIQRFSGIKIPKYKIEKALSENPSEQHDVNDELGYLDEGSHDSGYSMLILKMPVNHTKEEISKMSSEERAEASKTHDGHMIVGDIPEETREMLNGIYSLIGAETIRDDKAAGESTGTVLRLGVYQGSPIYIAEDYMDQSYYSGKPSLTVRLIGKNDGEAVAEGLNASQFKEFAEAIGDNVNAADMINDHNVTSKNYQEVVDLMHHTRRIIDAVNVDSTPKN